jgi:putative tricarboxylic transport membrane protein
VRRAWQVACVCLLGVFAAALAISLGYPLLDALGPGPGFFPFWLSVLGLALAGATLIEIGRGRLIVDADANSATEVLPHGRAALKTVAVLVVMTAATAALEPLGFRLTMLAFIAALLMVLGARSVPAIALTAVAGSFGVFHVFYYWLKVPLPIGALGI